MKAINIFLQEMNTLQIYCDMDGVLCDWDGAFLDISDGLTADEYTDKYGEGRMWQLINSKGIEWWSKMPWMKDGKDLWNFILPYKPIILSKPALHRNSIIGKKLWIRKNLGKDIPYILERKKEKYADKLSILIDDQVKNLIAWKQKGGIPLLHKNTKETIGRLKNILR